MAKSEKRRQKAVEKRKRKAKERGKKAATRTSEQTFEGQVSQLAALSTHSGTVVKRLMEGLEPEQVAVELELKVEKVYEVLEAFDKIPRAIQEMITTYPESLANGKLVEAIKVGSRIIVRGVKNGYDASANARSKILDLLQEGGDPS